MNTTWLCAGATALVACAGAQSALLRDQPNQSVEAFLQSIPSSLTQNIASPTHLRLSPFGSSANHCREMRWFFRAAGSQGADQREYAFGNGNSPGGPSSAGGFVGDLTGNLDEGGMDFTVTNDTAGYAFTSRQRWTLRTRSVEGYSGTVLTMTNTVQNTGPGPMTLDVFNYADLDPGGSTLHEFRPILAPGVFGVESSLRSTDLSYAAGALSVPRGVGGPYTTMSYQAAGDGSLRAALLDGQSTSLDGSVSGSPGDLSVATQWQMALGSGETASFEAVIFFGLVPSPGSSLLLGAGVLALCGRRTRTMER